MLHSCWPVCLFVLTNNHIMHKNTSRCVSGYAVQMQRSMRTCLTQQHLAFRQGRDLQSALTGGVHPPPRACSSVVIQSPLGGAHLSPRCTAAPNGRHLPLCRVGTSRSLPAFTHELSLFGLPPGCVSPVTLILAMLTSEARTATKNSLISPEAAFKRAIDPRVFLSNIGSCVIPDR